MRCWSEPRLPQTEEKGYRGETDQGSRNDDISDSDWGGV